MPTTTAKMRADVIRQFGRDADPLELNEQEFRFTALRPGMGNLNIDGLVENVDWTDGTDDPEAGHNDFAILTGNVTLRKPNPDQEGAAVRLKSGHRIRCEVRWGGQWRDVWTMRLYDDDLDVVTGPWTFQVADDFRQLSDSTDDFDYKRGKHRKRRGWRYHEIVLDVCERYRVPVGKIVRGKHRISRLRRQDTSPLGMLQAAIALEERWTGRRLVLAWRDGRVTVTEASRSSKLYMLADQITNARITTTRRGDLCTVLVATASIKEGKRRRRITRRVTSRKGMQRYGLIRREVSFRGIDSEHELVVHAKRSLAKRLKPVKSLTLSHPGIALIRRGDALEVSIPSEGYEGRNGLVFCQGVTHRVSAGEYTMELILTLTDSLDPRERQREQDRAARRRKRERRGR